MAVAADVLTLRALNRATMARQLLLERSPSTAVDAVAHLVGLQAQEPRDPYVALWSRLVDFDPVELAGDLESRRVVRIVVMRATIHLVTADDALVLRPLCQPVLDAELARHPEFGRPLRGVDVAPVLAHAAARLADQPMNGQQLRAELDVRFPELDARALSYACRCLLALVQVPPRGLWGRRGQVTLTTLESWVRRPLATDASIDEVVLRYLRAFGPALPADVAAWSRLTGFREVLERLRPRLRTFRDGRGRELFDVPDGARPDPDTPAPVRFLPMYDNAVLSHADRSRYTPDLPLLVDGPVHGSVLHDGVLAGTWSVERSKATTVMTVRHRPLPRSEVDDVEGEGAQLLDLLEPAAETREVRTVSV